MVGRENVHCIVFEENRFILDLLGVVPEENMATLSSRNFWSLVSSRVVTLFGPETPAPFAVRSGRNTALWAGIACSPCVNAFNNRQSPCRNNLCLQQTNADQVFAATCRAYEESKAAQRI